MKTVGNTLDYRIVSMHSFSETYFVIGPLNNLQIAFKIFFRTLLNTSLFLPCKDIISGLYALFWTELTQPYDSFWESAHQLIICDWILVRNQLKKCVFPYFEPFAILNQPEVVMNELLDFLFYFEGAYQIVHMLM